MAVISVFCDESGKFHDKSIVSFCGLSASSETLQKFESKWGELLRRHEIKHFKVSEALKAHRELSRIIPAQTVEERANALRPFAACIGENYELGISIAVNVEAFKRTKQHIKKQVSGGDDPFYLAFLRVVLEFARRSDNANVSIVCDDDQETAPNCLRLYRKLRNMEDEDLQRLSSITFADDRVFPALQAADMLSGLVRLEAGRQLLSERNEYVSLTDYMVQWRGPMYTQWGFRLVGEREMAKVELSFKNRM